MTSVLLRSTSMSRFCALRDTLKQISLLRALQYERFALLSLEGRVLDFGGGIKINYAHLLPRWGNSYEYQSANIDPETKPTYLLSVDGRVPVADGYFDAVISLNTLEHVSRVDIAVKEIARVLKPGGRFLFTVPFMFRVHGHPDDYHRGTPSFWSQLLREHEFSDVAVEALNWGPFSTGVIVSGMPGPFKQLRLYTSMVLDLLYFSLRRRSGANGVAAQDAPTFSAPLGYFVSALRKV